MPVYTLSGVEVEFPYEAYPCQLDYMTKVIQALQQSQHALLESPTGTGKTLCLLCASLAWRQSLVKQAAAHVGEVQQNPHGSTLVQGLREAWAEHRASQMEAGAPGSGLPQIIYSSRTHSQLQQVMRELKNCGYRPRTATVASRQHGCLHPVVSTMQAGANQACRALVAKRACKWYNGVEKFTRQNPDVNSEVLDIEDLARIGESRAVCPYYLARSMASTADIVFMPYNYLIDAKTRAGLGIQWANAVLIFDEAHNVEQVCADSMSFDLPASVLAAAIEELGTAAELAASAQGSAPVNVYNELGGQDRGTNMAAVGAELSRARAVLVRLEQEVAKLATGSDSGLTRPGAFLFEMLGSCGINMDTWQVLYDCLDQATSVLTEEAVNMGRRSGSRATSYSLHKVGEALRLAFVGTASEPAPEAPALLSTGGQWPPPRAVLQHNAAKPLPPYHAAYKVHVHMDKNKQGRTAPTLSYWCFSPALSMKQITDMQVRSILLTSGTLSPLDSFAHELGLDFPVRLENPHVIAREQVWVGVVPQGPSGHALNSSYQNRDNAQYRADLGMALVNFARIIPDGLLVFFPSYALLQSCITTWKQVTPTGGPSIWERIVKSKQPVVEPRESAAFASASEDFRAKLANPAYNGAVFFAVTRGKASEGLDFSDAAGRAVVLTGIPYPMKMDPKVRLKQESLNEARGAAASRKRSAGGGPPPPLGISGDQWYSQSAMRAVNQAVGRVIRHRRDYGAIILCDERFRQPGVQRQLSCWLRDHVTVYQSYGAANGALVQFFKQQAEAARKGLVDGGGQATVPGAARTVAALGGGPAGPAGPFQAIAAAAGRSGRTLMQSAPAAIDAVGMTELFAPVAAAAAAAAAPPAQQQQRNALLGLQQPAQQQQQPQHGSVHQRQAVQLGYEPLGGSFGGSASSVSTQGGAAGAGASRLMTALGGGGGGSAPVRQVSGHTSAATAAINSLLGELGAAGPAQQQGAAPPGAQGQHQAGGRAGGGGGSGRLFEPRPWERAVLAAAARPCPPRAPAASLAAPGAGAAGNIVGPAHLVAKHAERQRQRSASVELEQPQQAQQEPAAGQSAGQQAQEQQQQGAAQPAGQDQFQQHVVQQAQQQGRVADDGKAGKKAKAGQQAETATTFLARLKATLSKEQFDAIRHELRAYSQTKDVPRLVAAALPLLQPHAELLESFAGFIPKAARPALQEQLQQLRGRQQAAAAATPAQQQQQARPAAQAPAARQAGQQQPMGGLLQRQQAGGRAAQLPGAQLQGRQQAQTAPPQPGAQHRQPLAAQQQTVRPGAAQQRPKKLQQLAAGVPLRQQPGGTAGAAGARPGGPMQHQVQQGRARATAGGDSGGSRAVLMPPRGMQHALVHRPGQAGAAMPAGRPGGTVPLMARPAAPPQAQRGSATTAAAGGSGRGAARGPPCPVCSNAPMESPHEAGCGHTACYACWMKALALFKCPVCSRGVRKNQLQKKYFA